jgi:dolichol-phosphate mannosyltransferase
MSAVKKLHAIEPEAVIDSFSDKSECEISIVTSALNEEANARLFLEEASRAIEVLGVSGEILFIDDGSRDGTARIVSDYAREHCDVPIRLVRHSRPRGLAAAFHKGTILARGRLVCFLPADLESSPAEDIPKLYREMDDETDVVLGRRIGRGDGKQFASNIYNRLNSLLFNVHVRDGNWIKLIRAECLLGIPLRNDWHPFVVALLANAGCRLKEVDTNWYSRKHGRSKFGLQRFPRAAAAALSVKFHLTFGTRPMLFFFGTAAAMLTLGTILLVVSFVVNLRGDRLWSALQMFSVGFYVAGWLSVTTGLVVDILNRHSDWMEK